MTPKIIQKTASFLEALVAFATALTLIVFENLGRMPEGLHDFLFARITIINTLLGVVFLLAWRPCFHKLETAEPLSRPAKLFLIIRGATLISLVLAFIMYAAQVYTPAIPVIPCFWLASVALVSCRLVLTRLLSGGINRPRTSVLILGTGKIARRAWREIRTRHHRTLHVAGFIDIHGAVETHPEIVSNYLGNVDQLDAIFLKHVVDALVIAIPVRTCSEAIHKASAAAEKAGVDIIFHSFFPGQTERNLSASLGDMEERHFALPHIAKRLFDMAIASLALVFLSPILIAIGLLIKATSPGPALFVQERYGYRRRKFKMYKFRTMVSNAEHLLCHLESENEANGPVFKMRNDPRITRVGRFLRKTSIDELPQLWNVLNGTMSLVGPRPMSVRDVSLFSDAYLMRRFRARPGITGLWQVSGRSDVKFEKWIELDFHYIDRWSLGLDFSILLRTIPAVFKGAGAM